MIDAFHFVTSIEHVPISGLVSMNNRSLCDACLNESERVALAREHAGDGASIAFTNDHNRLALSILIFRESAVDAIFNAIGRLDVTAEIGRVDFRNLALATDNAAFHLFRHCFAQFVLQDECRLVGQAQG